MSSLPLKMFSRQREIIHAKAWDHKTTHVVRKTTDGMASVKDTLGEGETDTLGRGRRCGYDSWEVGLGIIED